MSCSRGVPLVLALGLLAAFPCRTLAATVRPAPLAQLALRADRIIVSEVVEVRQTWEGQPPAVTPLTLVTVKTLRTIKGPGSVQLVLEFAGGAVGAERLEIPDLPRFEPGDRDVLFLHDGPRAISPLVGFMHGRFRIWRPDDASLEFVSDHAGRPLVRADLGDRDRGEPRAAQRVSLAAFQSAIQRMVAPGGGETTPDGEALDRGLLPRPPSPVRPAAPRPDVVEVALGPSPALLDGCDGWACAAGRAVAQTAAAAGLDAPPALVIPATAIGGRHVVTLAWGHSVAGRTIDPDVMAVTVRHVSGGVARTSIVFNESFAWNSYDGPTRRLPSGHPLLDLVRVASRELTPLLQSASDATDPSPAPSAAPGPVTGAMPNRRSSPAARGVSGSRAADAVVEPRAGCDSGGALIDPRLLTFQSPDHAVMTGYQVGFFQPGAPAATQVVDVPLSAFLLKMVVDLPPWAAAALQTSLVADIRGAGLATPVGIVYTYRVRGVWAGGTTGWSDPSPPFVRCSAPAR